MFVDEVPLRAFAIPSGRRLAGIALAGSIGVGSARRENFRRRENFGKKKSGRRERFRQKIVEIAAILASKFENFACHFLVNSADRRRIYANLITIR